MSNFFLSDKFRRKKKNVDSKKGSKRKLNGSKKLQAVDNYSVDSDSEYESDNASVSESEKSDEETVQDKRLRLAKEYLAQLEDEASRSLLKCLRAHQNVEISSNEYVVQQREKNHDVDLGGEDVVGERLQQDVLEKQGSLQRKIAGECACPEKNSISILSGHKLSLTCLCISSDDKTIFSAAKDCSIIKWDLKTGKKLGKILGRHADSKNEHSVGHEGHILAIAVSTDGQYLASGGEDKHIRIWNAENLNHIRTFKGHRDFVTGLAFRQGFNQLFSASKDRSVKIWSLDEMAYVDTLYGHEDGVTAIDSMKHEQAVTCAGRDTSVRLWKVATESQLVFNGSCGSIDCLKMINEKNFISGADDGSLSLWTVTKKKPLCSVQRAHGLSLDDHVAPRESWVTAIGTVRNSDLLATGSSDSHIRLWQYAGKSLVPLFSIPVVGFVNTLVFSSNGDYLVAGVGQEHRLGRWWRIKEAKNSICVIPLPRTTNPE